MIIRFIFYNPLLLNINQYILLSPLYIIKSDFIFLMETKKYFEEMLCWWIVEIFMKKTLVYERILYELNKINKILSAKFFAQISVEINTIEIELNKHKKNHIIIYYYLILWLMIMNYYLIQNIILAINVKMRNKPHLFYCLTW